MNLTTIKASLVHLFTAGLLTAGLVTLGSCTTSETGNKNNKNAKNQYTEEEIAKFNNLTDIEVLMNTLSELDKIDNFYMPEAISTSKTFEDVLDALDKNKVIFQTPKIGDKFTLENTNFEVLSIGTDTSDLNDTSLVLKMN